MIPLSSFFVFSLAQVVTVRNRLSVLDFSYYDIGPGPISMRSAQLVDNLASFMEPVFYMQYSWDNDYPDLLKGGNCSVPKTTTISYCAANRAAQSVNLISGLATVAVNSIAVTWHIPALVDKFKVDKESFCTKQEFEPCVDKCKQIESPDGETFSGSYCKEHCRDVSGCNLISDN